MPRYYFSIDNSVCERDDEGSELADAHAARIAAITFAGEYLRDHPDLVWDGEKLRILVDDENHDRALTVTVTSEGKIAES